MNSQKGRGNHACQHDYPCNSAETSHQATIWTYYTEKGAPDRLYPFPRHYRFFLAGVETLFPANPYDSLPMEDDNV